jgi:hypothetical protein
MTNKNLKFLLIFSIGLLLFISAWHAFRHNVQIIKTRNSTHIQIKPSSTVPSTTGFKCPKTQWVDCMPTIGIEMKTMCSAEYLIWAKQNCPNFKGAAY